MGQIPLPIQTILYRQAADGDSPFIAYPDDKVRPVRDRMM